MDRVVTNDELCQNKNSDNFEKYQETVFQMDIKASHDIKANPWALYSDLDAEKAGFVCEKEGNQINFFCSFPLYYIHSLSLYKIQMVLD